MKNIIELFIRADAQWDFFGHFYLSQEYITVNNEIINDLKELDWIDSLEYTKEKTPGKNCNFFKIMDKCYEPSMEGDKHLFNEMEIYDNVEIYETDKNPEKYFNNIVEFINQGFFYSEDKRIFAYVSIYKVTEDTYKKLKNTQICVKDTLRNPI